MTELDKFKRRLVRSVSRLLKQDQEQQEKAWEQMRKETGCDCKLLWQRMRALTIKKIKRLLAAGDRNENIAAVARLSLTDWLLFDLVLVHEKLDVIGRDHSNKNQADHPVLEDLFELVQEYNIEGKSGDQLLEAWVALTRHYNSRGRQASPLLLQKRWYQLKENTRANFYKLWNSYKGNQKLWDIAKTYKPTPLHAEIAKRYPHIITQPFPEWEELIEMKKVILPEQFELQSRMRNRPKTVDDKPDLVVIEPVIETIELGEDSDEDPKNKVGNTQQDVNLALVKQEPIDVEDGLSNVKILEATHIPMEQDEDNSNSHLSSIGDENRTNLAQQMSNFMQDTETEDITVSGIEFEETTETEPTVDTSEVIEDDVVEIPDDLIKQKAEEYIKSKTKSVTEEKTPEVEVPKEQANADDDIMDDIIKQKADAFVRKVDMQKLVHDVVDEFKLPEETAGGTGMEMASEIEFADDGIEFEDDGIEYVEEDESIKEQTTEDQPPNSVVKTEVSEEKEEEGANDLDEDIIKESDPSPKFDLKLLMEPVVYTTKLDDMIIFKGKKFDFVELQNVIDSVIIESKPVSKRAIKVETDVNDDNDNISQTNSSQADRSINDDLFRSEILKDFNLQDSPVKETSSSPPSSNQTKNSLPFGADTIKTSPKNVPHHDDNNAHPPSDNDYESDDPIDESLKVKPTSYLLQKPRNRSYNPIILCKNPDFNTRLKRLTASFFSSERNRRLFSYCKPMTIDLHKAFEHKLVNGTLYLKSSEGTPQPVIAEIDEVQSTSVMPSAMPIQSLLAKDQGKTNIQDLLAPSIATVDLTQRKKTVDLKDLSEVRKINQHLLTAQVPPMRVESSGFVNNCPAQRSFETHVMDLDDDDEPKVTGVSGGQDAKPQVTEDQQKNDIGSSFRGRGGGRGGASSSRGRGAIPKHKQVPFRPLNMPMTIGGLDRTPVPWRLGPSSKPSKNPGDEFLITIDTLNRMINKIDGTAEYKHPKKKNKKPNWVIDKIVRKALTESNSKPLAESNSTNSNDAPASSEAVPMNTIDVTAALNKPDSPVPEVVENVSVETTPLPKPKKKSRRKFCCYSREKLSRPEFGGTNLKPATWKTHPCPLLCQCCCRDDLLDAIKKLGKIWRQQTDTRPASPELIESDAIVLSDGECDDNAAIDDDSSDVRIPGFDPEEDPAPKPRLRVYNSNKRPASVANCTHTHSTCTTSCTGRGYPMTVAGVSTTVSTPVPTPASTPAVVPEPQPLFRINVNFAPAPVSETPNQPVVIPSATTEVMPQTTFLERIASQMSTPAPAVTSVVEKTALPAAPAVIPVVQKPVNPVPTVVSKGLKKVTVPVPPPKRQIVIDATCGAPSIESAIISSSTNKKEDKVLVLNSKALSTKPKESPIFLGKDTILLTTVKFPLNFGGGVGPKPLSGLFAPKPQVPPEQPKVAPSMSIPSGVQLVLMPDGQLTYIVEPTTTLDEAQLAAMPVILAAVQEQINIGTKQTEAAALNLADTIASSSSVVVSDKVYQTNIESQPQGELIKLLTSSKPANAENVKDQIEVPNETSYKEPADKSNAENVKDQIEVPDETSDKEPANKSNAENVKDQIEVPNETSNKELADKSNAENVKDQIEVPNETSNNELAVKSNDDLSDLTTTETFTEKDTSTKDPNSLKEPEIIDIDAIEETDEPATVATATVTTTASTSENNNGEQNKDSGSINIDNETNDSASGSRNLLSDLMEMSGISAEDTTLQESPTKQIIPALDNVVNPIVPDTANLAADDTANPALDNVVNPIVPDIVNLAADDTANPAINVVSTSDPVATSNAINLPELSPITSLTELKYACDHNGTFFKLDLNTGVIAPINVCIKKNLKAPLKTRVIRPVTAKGIIDLTDGDDAEIPKNITKDGNVKPIKLLTKPSIVEPIKVFKGATKQPIILKRNNQLRYVPFDAMQSQIKKNARKQSLLKVDARINLVDSDAPMEEEYLVDSSDSDSEMPTTSTTTTTTTAMSAIPTTSTTSEPHIVARRVIESSDDSSDEEPLAKKFKRLRDKNQSDLEKISAVGDKSEPKDDAVCEPTDSQIETEAPVPVGPPIPAVLETILKSPVRIPPKSVALAPVVSPVRIAPRPPSLSYGRPRPARRKTSNSPVRIAPKPGALPPVSLAPVKVTPVTMTPVTVTPVTVTPVTPVTVTPVTVTPVPKAPEEIPSPITRKGRKGQKRTVHLEPIFRPKVVSIAPKPAVLKEVPIGQPKPVEALETDPSTPIVKLTPIGPEGAPIGPESAPIVPEGAPIDPEDAIEATNTPVPATGQVTPVVPETTTDSPEDADDNSNSDDMEIEDSQFLATFLDNEESQEEEDCILGV